MSSVDSSVLYVHSFCDSPPPPPPPPPPRLFRVLVLFCLLVWFCVYSSDEHPSINIRFLQSAVAHWKSIRHGAECIIIVIKSTCWVHTLTWFSLWKSNVMSVQILFLFLKNKVLCQYRFTFSLRNKVLCQYRNKLLCRYRFTFSLKTKLFCKHSFSYIAPTLWNTLPKDRIFSFFLLGVNFLIDFRSALKTHLSPTRVCVCGWVAGCVRAWVGWVGGVSSMAYFVLAVVFLTNSSLIKRSRNEMFAVSLLRVRVLLVFFSFFFSVLIFGPISFIASGIFIVVMEMVTCTLVAQIQLLHYHNCSFASRVERELIMTVKRFYVRNLERERERFEISHMKALPQVKPTKTPPPSPPPHIHTQI